MKKIVILPEDVCCDRIVFGVENGIIRDVHFDGGCDGNGKALARLLEGMSVDTAIERLAGVDCEGKGTSCADQLVKGILRELAKGS